MNELPIGNSVSGVTTPASSAVATMNTFITEPAS